MFLIRLLFWVFFLVNFFYTFADEKIVLLDYKNIVSEKLNDLYISTWDSNLAEIINDEKNKKIYLNINDTINKNDISLQVSLKWNNYKLNYKYIPKFKPNLDISKNIKLKRIQKRPLSCELSVTADILSHLTSKVVSEDDVFEKIDKTYLDTLPYIIDNKLYWGNPNKGFVWYIDYYWSKSWIKPTQRDMTWYGIYEKPISEVYKSYWFDLEIITKENYKEDFNEKKHLSYLLKNLERWNMVQLWADWCTREEYDDGKINKYEITQEKVDNKIYAKNYCNTTLKDRKIEWNYIENFEEKKHIWLIWEHAFYLLWYNWGVENPTKIIVWDSDTGYHRYDTEEWLRKWELMDFKSIVIKKY